jgi:hypothetical protein
MLSKSGVFWININSDYKENSKCTKMLTTWAKNLGFTPPDSENHGPSIKDVFYLSPHKVGLF